MDETVVTNLLECVEAEIVAAGYHFDIGEYTSARLCAEDACNLLADFIVAVKELESA